MRYFKLIKDNNIIFGVSTSDAARKYEEIIDTILFSNMNEIEFIQYKDVFYYDYWMTPISKEIKIKLNIKLISIIEIDEEEFTILKDSLQIQQQVKQEEQQNIFLEEQKQKQEPIKDPNETLQYVKKIKILELQRDNQKKITQGSDITLENGKTYHFSFDNMGLFNLIATMNAQQESQENISFILQKMNEFKQQCDSYCNNLIQQVQSLDNIKDINDIHYQKKEEGDN